MQMTQLKELNVVNVSSGLACALTTSSRCFCRTCWTDEFSVKSTSSTVTGSTLCCLASLAVPSSLLRRFAEGPGVGDCLFLVRGGESGALVRST